MKSFLRSFFVLLLTVVTLSMPVMKVWAQEEKSESSGEDKRDVKKGEEGQEGSGNGGGQISNNTKKKGEDDVSGGRFAGDPVYVHLSPMVMPIITDNGAEQLVTFTIDIQVKDFDTADNIHSNMPRVVDALMQALYGGLGQGSLRNGKMVDVAKIKAKATEAITSVIGDGIKDVLIQGVSQRML